MSANRLEVDGNVNRAGTLAGCQVMQSMNVQFSLTSQMSERRSSTIMWSSSGDEPVLFSVTPEMTINANGHLNKCLLLAYVDTSPVSKSLELIA